MDEQAYKSGRRAALVRMLEHVLEELGCEIDLGEQFAYLVSEREATVNCLRELCGQFGDQDWEDNLHLGDVIEKHLRPYLVESDT